MIRGYGIRLDVVTTVARGDARRAARDCPLGVDAIIVAGGDGTVNEVANGLLERRDGPIPLGLIPMGTANVLASELGVPCKPEQAARALLTAEPQQIHLGAVNGEAFLVMAGVGLDGRTVSALSPWLKRRLGRLAYALEIVRQIFLVPAPSLFVRTDTKTISVATIVVANGHYYAGRFVLAPNAWLTRRGLHLWLAKRGGPWPFTRLCIAALCGRLDRLADVRVEATDRVRVEEPAGEPVQADGDTVAQTPVTIEVCDRTIDILVPNRLGDGQSSARHGHPLNPDRR